MATRPVYIKIPTDIEEKPWYPTAGQQLDRSAIPLVDFTIPEDEHFKEAKEVDKELTDDVRRVLWNGNIGKSSRKEMDFGIYRLSCEDTVFKKTLLMAPRKGAGLAMKLL